MPSSFGSTVIKRRKPGNGSTLSVRTGGVWIPLDDKSGWSSHKRGGEHTDHARWGMVTDGSIEAIL